MASRAAPARRAGSLCLAAPEQWRSEQGQRIAIAHYPGGSHETACDPRSRPLLPSRGEASACFRVPCLVLVSYDLSKVVISDGQLLLPAPTVTAGRDDSPGQRVEFTCDCGLLRSTNSPAVDALKYRLLDEALSDAQEEYLRD